MTATLSLPVFTAGMPAAHVDASLRQALSVCDRARECAALWFAEVQRRGLYRELGHASLQLYATEALGFTDNRYWQFKRLADDLERLPVLREAVASGDLGWTKAQQVARVATVATQDEWVAKAATCGRRELAAAVKVARRKPVATDQMAFSAPAAEGGAAADFAPRVGPVADLSVADLPVANLPVANLPVAITLPADGLRLARFEALLEKARKLKLVSARADRLDVVLAGLEALIDAAAAENPRRGAAPAIQIVVQQCPDCAAASVVTSRGEKRLAPAQVEAVNCDARVRVRGGPNRATIKPSVRAAVLARDRHRCTAPGCRSTHFLEVHHVTPRSQGGSNLAENLVTLCSRCHAFVHESGGAGLASGHAPGIAPAQVEVG
jgi:hypothetical protein